MPHRSQSPCLVLVLVFAAACAPLLPTPDDFPERPLTPFVEFPATLAPALTPRLMTKPIFADDMVDARTFFMILKVGTAAGDSSAMTEHVLYPIEVRVNGQLTLISSAAEFDRQYAGIFNSRLQDALLEADEGDLALQLDGIMAAGGALWFNQFCADAACTRGEFLITQINN